MEKGQNFACYLQFYLTTKEALISIILRVSSFVVPNTGKRTSIANHGKA